MLLVLSLTSVAEATTDKRAESVVVGANLAIALGELPAGRKRLGGGIDVGYQYQWYTEVGERIEGDFAVWAEERPAWAYGPTVHVWRVAGAWNTTLGGRFGAAWPLRMGLMGGWIPGPGVAGELGVLISTAGYVGLDGQADLDASYVQARLGTALTANGLDAKRGHLGVATPTTRPELWPSANVSWDRPQ